MKTYKLILIVGILGVVASVFGMITQQDISTHLIGFICGASLIYGYFELKEKATKN